MPMLIAQILFVLVYALVVGLVLYVVAHTWVVRPFITLIERAIGREFFPYLDRIWPR